jgi:hypothetical protein
MSTAASVVPDPFADDLFAPLAPNDPEGTFEDELQKIANEQEGASFAEPPVAPVGDPAPVTPKPADEPTVYQYPDGSQVTIEHGTRGWKATLDSATGAPAEIFYGSTKDELLVNLSAGKINATQKIRELNKKAKLGVGPVDQPAAQPIAPVATASGRELTGDEIFELKTLLQDNPDAAIEKWFLKKTGLSVAELVKVAKTGKSASDELSAEAISKEFLSRHPDYVPYEKNFEALIAWLCKYKLNQPLQGRDPNTMIETLFNVGQWTAETLDEAYEDLLADGLLDLQAEEEPEPVVPAAPAAPAAPVTPAAASSTTSNDRIVRERRPRAGNANLGIRTSETVARNTEVATPPSVEELDNLSDGDVEKLLAGVRQLRLGTRR